VQVVPADLINAYLRRILRTNALSIFDPSEEDSKIAGRWAPQLDSLRDQGWRMAYTDGSGAEGCHAAGVASEGPCGTRDKRYGEFAGEVASVADAERLRLAIALETEHPEAPLALASDSQAAILTLKSLAEGNPPRSGIERRIKDGLERREGETGALWVRSHIGIPGNEAADRQAELSRIRGNSSGHPGTTTYEGLMTRGRARRSASRTAPGFGKRRTEWGKHALAAYTWTRTNRGPQKAWRHHVGKAEDPSCPCGHPSQDGDHLVFHCPQLHGPRARLLPEDRTWESLDDPHWVIEAGGEGKEQEKIEGTEAFFQDLYWFFKQREGGDEEELE